MKEIVLCMTSNPKLDSSSSSKMKSLSENLSKENQNQLMKIIGKHRNVFLECIKKNQKGESLLTMDEIYGKRYDWKNFAECLKRKNENKTFDNILQLIETEKYYEAIKEKYWFTSRNNQIVKDCWK